MKKELDMESVHLKPVSSMRVRRSIGQFIYDQLKQNILEGDIVPGTRLSENALAEAAGASRTPVREAFHKLENEGLIKIIPQGSYVVTGLTREEIEDIFGIRVLLETYAAGLAAINHNEEDLVSLQEIHEKAHALFERDRLDEIPRMNSEFHERLYSLSRRPKLIEILKSLAAQTYRFRSIILKDKGNARKSLSIHKKILESLRLRDRESIERLIRDHIERGMNIVMSNLKEGSGEF